MLLTGLQRGYLISDWMLESSHCGMPERCSLPKEDALQFWRDEKYKEYLLTKLSIRCLNFLLQLFKSSVPYTVPKPCTV